MLGSCRMPCSTTSVCSAGRRRAGEELSFRAELVAGCDAIQHRAMRRFDMTKCAWFNAQYLRELSPEDLLRQSQPAPFWKKRGLSCGERSYGGRGRAQRERKR